MLDLNEEGKNKKIIEAFRDDYLPQKFYYRHSDIDIFVNITITQLLNYDELLSEEIKKFIQENFGKNYKYYNEIIRQKNKALSSFKTNNIDNNTNNNTENKTEKKNSILSFDFPEFEIYFVAKLFIDGMERKPECQTKLLFNSNNINQYISMRFKYKDLTLDSYIILELYSMQIIKDNLLGKTKIYLFDDKMNLNQGRHIFKLIKHNPNDTTNNFNEELESELELDEIGKEIDFLINNFYGNEIIQTTTKNTKIDIKEKQKEKEKEKENIPNNLTLENCFYNHKKKTIEIKTDNMKYFENSLNELLPQTNNCYIVIKFPSFGNTVIYEEDISADYKALFQPEYVGEFKNWVQDPYINIERKDFLNKDNPISEKFSNLTRGNDDDELYARDMRLNPVSLNRINKLLNTPDFIKLDNNDITLFWSYRYELLKNNTPCALTKIMNSVKWGDLKSENEFIKNILLNWKTIEICDILYMLSRKFSVNNLYPNDENLLNNLEGMKELRKFAVKKLGEIKKEELNFILLQLVQAIRYEDISTKNIESPLVSFLIETCSKDSILASSFYWFIECEADNDISNTGHKNKNINNNLKEIIQIFELIRKKFFNNLQENHPNIEKLINNEKRFKNELVQISDSLTKVSKVENKKIELRNIIDTTKKDIMQNEINYLPIDPHIKIKGTITEQCSVFKSAKCPVKYTFKVEKESQKYNPHEDKEHISMMFKYGDDLRQDQLILQMIYYMDSLLKSVHLNYEFTTYKVLATSKSDGFVEFVPNSKTIFDILKKYNNVIYSYYKEISNFDENILKKYLNSYINSCAGYCVVTYILGIGDRHLENLMIDNRGRLFHIDFGFILGKDPKPAPPPIKLCQEMVDCMGGKGSKNYEEFKQKCVNAYWVLRENARVIVNMFYLMIDSGIPELNDIEKLYKLHDKFVPGYSKQEASNSFLTNLEESVNALMPVLMEKIHAWAQYWK